MTDEIELVRDGDGMAVIGEPSAVERFLRSEDLRSPNLDLDRLRTVAKGTSAALQTGSHITEHSGRWVKLTEKSAAAMKKFDSMKGSAPGLGRGVFTENVKIQGLLQFARGGVGHLANAAVLAGAAGIMAQMAMSSRWTRSASTSKPSVPRSAPSRGPKRMPCCRTWSASTSS